MNYHIITFGCQMNKSDSERIAQVLEKIDYQPTPEIEKADLIVVNMCSVRQSAVDRVFGLAEKFKGLRTQTNRFAPCNCKAIKNNPQLTTILTGCILKKDRKKFQEIFNYILDIKDLPKWPKILNNLAVRNSRDRENFVPVIHVNNISAFVPIMTGCNNFCAYCVVPYTRGREISRPAKEIICEIENLIKRGYKEIWLLGQNVNSYKDGKINFPKLLKMVNDVPGGFWIRFTSSHPKDFSDELINTMAKCEKYGHYLNLPVQAGDDKILKKMNRHYTITQYKKLIQKIRKKISNITLSTDVIVGFPGETKKQFENSVKLFKEIKYDMAYIAEYSPRFGTAAAKMKDDVPAREKASRKRVLNKILKKTALEKNKKYIGKEVEALIDAKKSLSAWIGKTREYKTIYVETKKNILGKFIKAKIVSVSSWGLKGKLL